MKGSLILRRAIFFLTAAAGIFSAQAQPYIAYDVPSGTVGNQGIVGLGVGNDFAVVQPITISQLGVFVSGTNGIQDGTVLTVQLYERSGRLNGTLLETMTFDAGSPGTRIGGSVFKPLPLPVTLLPGNYTIAAYGFDTNNPEGNAGRPPFMGSPPPWVTHDGGGLIRFEGFSRYGGDVGYYPGHLDKGPANRYAAGTFVFSAGTLATAPYAGDYTALIAGVDTFPLEDAKHLGSIAVLDNGAFPVLVEHGGNRLVIEAAGTYNGAPNGGRAVAFSHFQWERKATNDARTRLFENAIQWAAKKSNPSDIVMGITTNLDARFNGINTNLDYSYFVSRGYRVIPINCLTLDLTNGLPPMDVLVVDGHARYVERIAGLVNQFSANGGGLVSSMAPYFVTYLRIRPAFTGVNQMLAPFNLAYRPSLASPADLSFTNIQSVPYPTLFSAFPAAGLLHQDRLGQIHLDSQQKAIALNTIMYAASGQPQLLSQLTSVYSGTTNGIIQYPGNAGDFVDVATLNGAQTTTNLLGNWTVNGTDLVGQGRRGVVEYQLATPGADMYQLKIFAAQALQYNLGNTFNLVLTLDGQSLGRFKLTADLAGNTLKCLTPFITAGQHTLRIFWDNPASYTALRIKSVTLQTRLGGDDDGNGIKDWVDQMVQQQSGLDLTNDTIASYTSPVCVEGRDPYLKLLNVFVEGADSKIVNLNPLPEPNGRWFVNAPLSAFAGAQISLQTTFQNGGKTETHNLIWQPINLLDTQIASLTIRQGDSLLLNAKPTNAPNANLSIAVGTNQLNGRTAQPLACKFNTPGTFTVTGTYNPGGATAQSASINVKVIPQQVFTGNPDAWVGKQRSWQLSNVSPEVVLASDNRVFFEEYDGLPNNGRQINLIADQNEPRVVLARLGANGPVLDLARMNNFELWSGGSTYVKVLQVYPDGSQLVEMMVIVSPMPADLLLRLDVIVGGVVFDDGTTTKTLTATDFDPLGRAVVHFIRPASARTSVCHSLKAFQGNALVGSN
jgi:hypothetical protein